ncbi:MAG: HEAT repeat domain-containing protein [Candidatus Omnitrophota bacterium]
MIQTLVNKQFKLFRQAVVHTLLLTFGVSLAIPPQMVRAQSVAFLPAPGIMLSPSTAFTPAIMTGLRINPQNPLEFDFIIDTGDNNLQGEELSRESKKLINYFLTTLTVPNDELWVNLSPNEANRIIADDLVKTEMGRDMLAQDYLLKQLMASLMYPEEKTGREFWNRVHQLAYQKFGTTDIPTNTFNKIWIVPERGHVHVYQNNVFVVDSHLKVLLEEDYLSLKEHTAENGSDPDQWDDTTKEMIRTILIPEIEREINEGKNFANLRQIYQSMLLATWYKKNLHQGLLGKIYVDQNLVKGIDLADADTKEKIYQQYLTAFKKGVFDYIKEDMDPDTQQPIPRRYFSGGLEGFDQAMISEVDPTLEFIERSNRRRHVQEQVRFDLVQPDQATTSAAQELPVAYLTDLSRTRLFNDLIRAMGDYNLFGETSERFNFVATGYSRRAFQIPKEFPNLIFKLPRYDEQSEPPADNEPLIMSALAQRFGYEIVVIDGFELIKIEGIAPFRYYNNIIIQAYGEPTKDVRDFQTLRETAQRVGLPWELTDHPAPESQLKNIALFRDLIDGREVMVPMITDNKDFTDPDQSMLSGYELAVKKRLSSLAGWGAKRGVLSSHELEYLDGLTAKLIVQGVPAENAPILANALIRAKDDSLQYLVKHGYLTDDQEQALRTLKGTPSLDLLAAKLKEDQRKFEEHPGLTATQRKTAIQYLYQNFFTFERFTTLNGRKLPVMLVLKLARQNIHPDWWTNTGSPAFDILQKELGDHYAKRWIVDHPKDPLKDYNELIQKLGGDYQSLKTELGDHLAKVWVINHPKNPYQSYLDLLENLGEDYQILKKELGRYLAKRWIVTHSNAPYKNYQTLLVTLGDDYNKLKLELGEYFAKRWVVTHTKDPYQSYLNLLETLGEDYQKLKDELGDYLAKQWIVNHPNNPYNDWIKEGPQRVTQLMAHEGLTEYRIKKALVIHGTDEETTNVWLAVLANLKDQSVEPNIAFRKMTRTSAESFRAFLQGELDLSEEQLDEITSPLAQQDVAMLALKDFSGFDQQRMQTHFRTYADRIELNLRRVAKKLEDAPLFVSAEQKTAIREIRRELNAIHPVFVLSDPKSYVHVSAAATTILEREEWLAYHTLSEMVATSVILINNDLFFADLSGINFYAKALHTKLNSLRQSIEALAKAGQYQLVQSGELVLLTPVISSGDPQELPKAVSDDAMFADVKPDILTDRAILQLHKPVNDPELERQLRAMRDALVDGHLEDGTKQFIYGHLVEAVDHENPAIRQLAIEALGGLGTRQALYAMIYRENIAELNNTDPSETVREAEYDALSRIMEQRKFTLSPLVVDDLLYFILDRPRENNPLIRQKRTHLLKQIAVSPGISLHQQWRIINYLKGDLNPRYEPPAGRLLVTQALAEIGTNDSAEAIVFRGTPSRYSRPYEAQAAIRAAQTNALRRIVLTERVNPELISEMIAFAVDESLNHPDAEVRMSALFLLAELAFSNSTRTGQKKYILERLTRRFRRESNPDNVQLLVKAIPMVNAYYQGAKGADQALLITETAVDPELLDRVLGNVLARLPESMFDDKTRYRKSLSGVELFLRAAAGSSKQEELRADLNDLLGLVKQELLKSENREDQVIQEINLMSLLVNHPAGTILEGILNEMARPEHDSYFDADINLQHAYLTILETAIEQTAFVQTVDQAMTAASPQTRPDIAAAKLGLATDTQIFHLLMTRVPDEDILPITLDIRKAKEDGIKANWFSKNVFLSLDALRKSKYDGVRKFAELIATQPEIASSLDRMVQQHTAQPIKGVVLPPVRRAVEKTIAQISQSSDVNDKSVKERLASLRLSIASKRQIRKALIGQVEIHKIPIFVERILDIRENNPTAFNQYDQLLEQLDDLSAMLTPQVIDRINELINNEVSVDQLGLIERTDFAKTLRAHIAVIKAGQADAEALMTALLGEFNDTESEEFAKELAQLDRRYFANIDAFDKAPKKIKTLITENEHIQIKLDQLVTAYEKPSKTHTPTIIITRHEGSRIALPELSETPSVIDTTTPMKSYRFASSADLMALFQAQLDRFPRVQQNGGKHLMFSEFGGVMIRPQKEPQNRLTNIIFPETILSIPGAGRSLRSHTDQTFPQAGLMADINSNTLFAKVMADHLTDDSLTERVTLILTKNDVFFNADLWDYFSVEDQQRLAQSGFGPNMSIEQWVKAINNFALSTMNQYETNGKIVTVKELPNKINQRGAIGTMGSYHLMPGIFINALVQNTFTDDGKYFEMGQAHIHPKSELTPIAAEVAKRIGEYKEQMTVSPNDVAFVRGSQAVNNRLLNKYLGIQKNTGETFMSIVGVDQQGKVMAIRHHDFGMIDDQKKAFQLNDQAIATIKSGKPDIGLLVAHYEFFSDPSISSDQLGGDIGQHVGDPNYKRGKDESMLADIEDANIDLEIFTGQTKNLQKITREIRSIQSKAIIDYERLDQLNEEISTLFKQIKRVPPAETKEFRLYLDGLVSLMMATPVPLDFYTSTTIPDIHRELSRILSRLRPESLPEAQRIILAALSRFQRPLTSRKLLADLNKGFPVVLKSLADIRELAELQNKVNGVELNLTPVKGDSKSLVVATLGGENATRPLTFLADLPGYTDIHTHGFATPIEPSPEDTAIAEQLADTLGRSSMVIAFDRALGQIETAEFTPAGKEWVVSAKDQESISRRLMEIGLLLSPINTGITAESKISAVEPVGESSAIDIHKREDLDKLIDPPLLEAIRVLYDKNILTEATSANRRDVKKGEAYIHIPYADLSDANKLIALKLGRWITDGVKAEKVFSINIPIHEQTTVGELSAKAVALAEQFKQQPLTWAVTRTLNQLRADVFHNPELSIADAVAEGWYYDSSNEIFYLSEEHFRKVQEGRDEAMVAAAENPLTQQFAHFADQSQFLLNKIIQQSRQFTRLSRNSEPAKVQKQLLSQIDTLIALVNNLLVLPDTQNARPASPLIRNDRSDDTIFYNTIEYLVQLLDSDLKSIRNQLTGSGDFHISPAAREMIGTFEQRLRETGHVIKTLSRTDKMSLIKQSGKILVYTRFHQEWTTADHMKREIVHQLEAIGLPSNPLTDEPYGFKKIERNLEQLNALNARMKKAGKDELAAINADFSRLVAEIKDIIRGFSTLRQVQAAYPYANSGELVRAVVRNTIVFIIDDDLTGILDAEENLRTPKDATFLVEGLTREITRAKQRFLLLTETDVFHFIDPSMYALPRIDIGELELRKDESMTAVAKKEAPGGIDLNPENFDLKQSGTAPQFNIPDTLTLPQGSIEGIIPVIINITPVTNLPLLMGYLPGQEGDAFTQIPDNRTLPIGRPEDQISLLTK